MYACMHVCMYACMHVCMYACKVSRPRTCASFLLFRMVSRWAQWCVLLLLPRLLTLTCCSPAWTPTPRQGLRRQQGSMQMNKRLCGAEETSRSGIGVGSPSSSLRWLWKKRSNRSAAAHGKWQENSVPSDEDLNSTEKLVPVRVATTSFCKAFMRPRCHPTMRRGSTRPWLADTRTRDGNKWNTAYSYCCSAPLGPAFRHPLLSFCTERSSTPVAGCTAISYGWFGRCLPMRTGETSNNGTTVARTSRQRDQRTRRRPSEWPWKSMNLTRLNPLEDHVTRPRDQVPRQTGELCTHAGRPGPKSRGSAVWAAHLHPDPTDKFAVLPSRRSSALDRTADTRVGGNCGRYPPEAVMPSPKALQCTAKLNDPFQRTIRRQAGRSLLAPPASLRDRIGEHHDTDVCFLFDVALFLHMVAAQDSKMRPQGAGAPDTQQACMTAIILLLGLHGILKYTRRRTPQPWTSTRVVMGIYRRRPGRAARRFAATLCGNYPDLPAQPASRPRMCSVIQPAHRVNRWVWFVCMFSLVLPSSGALTHPDSPIPTVAPLHHVSAHGRIAARLTQARKRSFKRAQFRAMRDGVTT